MKVSKFNSCVKLTKKIKTKILLALPYYEAQIQPEVFFEETKRKKTSIHNQIYSFFER